MRTLAVPKKVGHRSLTTLRAKLVKIGAKEAARDLLEEILKDPNIPPEEANFMRDYIDRRLQ